MFQEKFSSICNMLTQTVGNRPNETAFCWDSTNGDTVSITWQDFYQKVGRVSRSLMALGLEKGEKAAILSYSSFHWVLADLGCVCCGGVTVGIYEATQTRDLAYLINHSDAKLVFAQNQSQLNKLLHVRQDISGVERVILFSGSPPDSGGWVMGFDEFLNLGEKVSETQRKKRSDALEPKDTAAIVYTSGTTGTPRGAVLTHRNIAFTSQSILECLDIRPTDVQLLLLPLAHVFARASLYSAMMAGAGTFFSKSMDTVAGDFLKVEPHYFMAVPRTYEKAYSRAMVGKDSTGALGRRLFGWARALGEKVSRIKEKKRKLGLWTRIMYWFARKTVLDRIRLGFGRRLRWCVSGAAPLDPRIARFFHGAGVLILEGVGMTENTSFSNVNRLDDYRFGSVGLPGPGVEQRFGPDGEILFRGPNIMQAYHKMPEETAQAIDKEGWLHSGDLGEIDQQGFLWITGRKKDLLITAGGKNIAPAAIEGMLATSPYIHQACVVGDRRKFLTALISLDDQRVRRFALENQINETDMARLAENPQIRALIKDHVELINSQLASFETIKEFALISPFTVQNGMLTPDSKVRKNAVVEQYHQLIDSLYPPE